MAWGMIAFAVLMALSAPPKSHSMKDTLTFLTRDGCVNTPDMLVNLDDALSALGLPKDYHVINIGSLPGNDVRTGYPTPTVLYKGKDIFGMAVPKPPFAVPS